jgi:dimethylhistidine N-methyltransferase
MYARALENIFAREVRAGLTRSGQKTLPCQYLYDEVGSALFEAITQLPEYGLTRADERIIRSHAGELIERLPRNLIVAELGCGTGAKTKPILETLRQRQPVVYYPIDTSTAALARCAEEMGKLASVFPQASTYLDGLREAAERRAPRQPLLVLFLGSTIGNFEPEFAVDFLSAVRQCLSTGDALLLGTDLVKPPEQLIDAYDDPLGVTAAFNLNLLGRINRELEADFDLREFIHEARYVEQGQRIEMHLRVLSYQIVRVPKADLVVDFAAGESILTENSHKYSLDQVCEMARLSGFRVETRWVDREWPFAENLLRAD